MNKKLPNKVDVQLGVNIRRIRNQRGISQEKLGEALGITFQQVQKYEKGANRVGGSRMQQIADALGVTIMDLYSGISGSDEPGNPMPTTSARGVRVGIAFDAIKDQKVKAKMYELMLTLSGQIITDEPANSAAAAQAAA